MRRFLLILIILLSALPVSAAVEVIPRGQQPHVIEDVYHRQGQVYIPLEELLSATGLTGQWDSVAHTYRIRTGRGWVVLSPAINYLRRGEEFTPLQNKPVFIDGRLHVDESFVQNQLPLLAGRPVFYRNLHPVRQDEEIADAETLDELFGRLLKREQHQDGAIRAIAIDPGHGGLDTGVIAADGYNEKILTFAVAERLARLLRMRFGIPVYLSRDGDYGVRQEERFAAASREDVDLWLLLHAQASFSAEVQGIDLFIRAADEDYGESDSADGSRLLAAELGKALTSEEFVVRGIYPTSRMFLGRGNLPTVQVELGYLSHPDEGKNMQRPEYQEQLALALFAGIEKYAELSREKGK